MGLSLDIPPLSSSQILRSSPALDLLVPHTFSYTEEPDIKHKVHSKAKGTYLFHVTRVILVRCHLGLQLLNKVGLSLLGLLVDLQFLSVSALLILQL